jgi:hypothetical protein
MEKQEVRERIAHKIKYDGEFSFGEIKSLMEENGFILEDNDIIECGYDEGYDSSDSGMDPNYFLDITRIRLETDTEFDNRKARAIEAQENNKKRRYENYLKLKEEFES